MDEAIWELVWQQSYTPPVGFSLQEAKNPVPILSFLLVWSSLVTQVGIVTRTRKAEIWTQASFMSVHPFIPTFLSSVSKGTLLKIGSKQFV